MIDSTFAGVKILMPYAAFDFITRNSRTERATHIVFSHEDDKYGTGSLELMKVEDVGGIQYSDLEGYTIYNLQENEIYTAYGVMFLALK